MSDHWSNKEAVTREWEGKEMGSASEQEHFGILRMEMYIEILINHCHHNTRGYGVGGSVLGMLQSSRLFVLGLKLASC